MLKEAINRVVEGEKLNASESAAVMREIISGRATDAQIGAYLIALRMRGETVDEIVGAAQAMRAEAEKVPVQSDAVDTCGTGGDRKGTFNISTVAALVTAAAGVPVAKHGNRSVSSSCGSADLLEALGVRLDLAPEKVGQSVDEIGIGFLFAPLLHRSMKHAIGPRREIGTRTIFNILGPLTNPAGVKRQVMGVYSRERVRELAEALAKLGVVRALVVHGDGTDEVTTTGSTFVAEVESGTVREYEVRPELFGVRRSTVEELRGGTPHENAELALGVLRGEKGPRRDVVVLNAGAAIWIGGRAANWSEGVERAEQAIDSGAALRKLEELRDFSRRAAA
ncbi:MAG TPA: anthranilate phosphoribosyltransferase [Bacteroidetes bacterium]|nr:anthranilate phosphoribosyltransferase [Bacteroidota bacterium]